MPDFSAGDSNHNNNNKNTKSGFPLQQEPLKSAFPPTRDPGRRRVVVVDSSGEATDAVLDRHFFVEQYEIPYRQLRILESSKIHSSSAQIFVNREAHVVNVEYIKLIIAADKCFLFQVGHHSWQYQVEEKTPKADHPFVRQLCDAVANPSRSMAELRHNLDLNLPFELKVLEVALSESIQIFESEAARIEERGKQALAYLFQKVSVKSLEMVRDVNADLVQLSTKLDRLNKELMELLDDDQDMLDLYLTHTKPQTLRQHSTLSRLQSKLESLSETLPPADQATKSLPRTHHFNLRAAELDKPQDMERSESDSVVELGITEEIETNLPIILESLQQIKDNQQNQVHPHQVKDVEALLDTYYMHTDFLLSRLKNLDDHFDDSKDIINIDLDNRRNELVALDLILSAVTAAFSFVAMMAGIFGMNLTSGYETDSSAFNFVCILSAIIGSILLAIVLIYSKSKGLMFIPQNPSISRVDVK
eukprot:TRINITY_DN7741_c0_g3_i3.p1 TRINITY_DN7741_c0_g3~~TRINITY_DN7741_c0_g3_i3.p1  ORF type:complete len:488 (-),score=62.50 TRINITY_DN7741_c0_g3_i3:862-2289(-)